MGDLIRREDALEKLRGIGITAIAAFAKIRDIPAVDAVDVVRCRECKRYFAEDEYCDCLDTCMKPDDFCSIGKRREEEHNATD